MLIYLNDCTLSVYVDFSYIVKHATFYVYFICFCAYILLKQHEENKVVCQTADIQQEREGHGGQLLIHFDGWSSRYDYWAEYDSPDLHPIGFMAEVGFQIPDIRGQIQLPKGEYLCRVLVYVHTCMYV